MFKQNIKRKEINKNQLIRYRRKKNKAKQKKHYGVCFHAEKNGLCTGKKKMRKANIHTKYTELQNTRIYTIWFWISDVSESFCRVRVTSPSSQSRLRVIQNFIVSSQSQSHDLVESE